MKPTEKIEQLKSDLIDLFGENDSIIRAIEVKEQYLNIADTFHSYRDKGIKYEDAMYRTRELFHVSESTVKRSISFTESMVHENELTS